MHSIRLPSYAKINLGLLVKGKRRDGFHEIETLLQQVSLNDEITLRDRHTPGINFHCDSPDVPSGSENLCVGAAQLLMDSLALRRGVDIRLRKRIPVGAGLGGGSSNAATVLLGLNTLWELGLGGDTLLKLAAELGSDVPFFIRGGTALARGRGEILDHYEIDLDLPILIVYPGVQVSTSWAYAQLNLSLTMKKKSFKLASFKDINFNKVDFRKSFKNDFEAIIFKAYPLLKTIKDTIIAQTPIFASMSGSGSGIFGVFPTEDHAREARTVFQNQYETFVVWPVSSGTSFSSA